LGVLRPTRAGWPAGPPQNRCYGAAVRQLLPSCLPEVNAADTYLDGTRGPIGPRPWVLANMIASVDGATAVEGVSGGLGGAADKVVFRAIRAVADLVLVAAGTARAEGYHAPRLPPELVQARRDRGRTEAPRLAIVSRRLELDRSLPLFESGRPRPIIVTTTDAPADRREDLARHAEIVACGEIDVDLVEALTVLRARYSSDVVLTEGGPSLLGALTTAGALDEICLTMAPCLIGGDSRRIVHGAHPVPRTLALTHLLEEDGFLFLRYTRNSRR
jgi:riboflavin biosynthesis pyrimidine reductase